jgi:pyruvate/2-oxoglutarate/acetoin dehydrogenase E1 component/TPP-dependent pyruvate/acetoin dehydrogenase alpha subunit
MDLLGFAALECPLLLPAAAEAVKRRFGRDEALHYLLEALARSLSLGKAASATRIHPGLDAGSAAGVAAAVLRRQIEGYFRREELREALRPEDRLRIYRAMLLSRELDDVLKRLHTEKTMSWEGHPSPQKGFRALGQEAAAALALALRPYAESGDVVSPLIRGLPVLLMVMDDPAHVVRVQAGKAGTPMEGRDFHVGDLDRGVLPPAAPLAIGVQTLVGLAFAAKAQGRKSLFLSIMGEGGTSLGEWHEALNFAAVRKLPVVFVVENNRWALGTPASEQSAASRFALKAAGYGIPGITIDGNDADEVAAAALWAGEEARSGRGPVLVELATYRRAGHAHHDDDRFHGRGGYENAEERRIWEAADPLEVFEARLRRDGLLDEAAVATARLEARRRSVEAEHDARRAPWPRVEGEVYAPRREPVAPPMGAPGPSMSYDEAIRDALASVMEADPRVFVLGEDVGGRYGGAFGVTRGLSKRFGEGRCLNTPLAESALLGCAVGAALGGLRPVAELQFADFVACGFNALVNNAAKVWWRWRHAVPMVVRLPYGGMTADGRTLLGGGPFHAQCPEAWFLRVPGLKIVAPSTPTDAKGLLVAALRDGNPVLYMEAKGLYGFSSPGLREPVPAGLFEVPLGQAIVRRPGKDVTLLSYGAAVHASLAAAALLEREGIDVEVLDLRTLAPLDEAAVGASVARTHRAVIVHEDSVRGGVGAELAAILAERFLEELDAPIVRVGAADAPPPYAPPLEHAFLPNAERIGARVRDLVRR